MLIKRELICINDCNCSWKEAANIVSELLMNNGYVKENYSLKIIEYDEEFGPYIVIAPGIALFHARPEDGVIREGVSLAVFKNGVTFGTENDPVKLVFALAPDSNETHIEILRQISEILSNKTIKDKIINASDVDEIVSVLNSFI